MPVTAQTLPPARSVYDYPITIPGQELTPAQVEQANIAKIAGIVTAVAAGKKALTDAVTMQVVALLRAAEAAPIRGRDHLRIPAEESARVS